jgi:hypothetical protein
VSGTVSQSRPSLADLLMGVQPPDGPIPLASMRMPSDLAGVPLASMFPVGQSLTMPSPDVSLMQPGSMPTTAQMAAQPVSQYVNPRTGAFTPEGMQRARDVTDTAMAMGGVGPSGGGFRAYHGSPHAFDQFDLSKIGTGEGAQAFGHGAYLADAEDVARSYRDALTPQNVPNPEFHALQREYNAADAASRDAMTKSDEEFNAALSARDAVRERQKGVPALIPNPAGTQGHMYEVQVNADPAHFLDWDRPLSEQHPVVQQALASIKPGDVGLTPIPTENGIRHVTSRGFEVGPRVYDKAPGDISLLDIAGDRGMSAVENLASWTGSHANAAQKLAEAGIPGIRYLDAGSRGAGEGSSNTVVFSPEIMDIIRRYGLAGLMAGGGAAAGMQQTGGETAQ